MNTVKVKIVDDGSHQATIRFVDDGAYEMTVEVVDGSDHDLKVRVVRGVVRYDWGGKNATYINSDCDNPPCKCPAPSRRDFCSGYCEDQYRARRGSGGSYSGGCFCRDGACS